jgi:Fe-S cluster assembly scaffold protein SufB
MDVRPQLDVRLAPGARYFSDFSLTRGTVGRLRIGQRVTVNDDAIAEVTVRLSGRGVDEIRIRDELLLAGRASRGLVKTRIALCDDARAEVVGITCGRAEGARGHMDCLELVRDRAVGRAEPIVEVSHPLAKVTHEAAIGTVDQHQLETLMAHGLAPDEAIDLIVTGILQ